MVALLCALAVFCSFISALSSDQTSFGLRRFPRVELHVHLDGSIDVDELFEVSQKRGLEFPGGFGRPASPSDVQRYLKTITPAWHKFDVVNNIIGGDVSTIKAIAKAFVRRQAMGGVGYTEVRYDATRLAYSAFANTSISEKAAVQAVQEGLASGAAETGVVAYQILAAMRGKSAEQCNMTAHLAAAMRSTFMGGVVGLDLAGDESDYPNPEYIGCMHYAKTVLGLNTTVHAGEFPDCSPKEVSSAVFEMRADRVGHGYAAAQNETLMDLLRERGVHLEACPASATHHSMKMFNAIGSYKKAGLSFGLNTDDYASFFNNASLADCEALVEKGLGFVPKDIVQAYAHARAAAFGPLISTLPSAEELLAI